MEIDSISSMFGEKPRSLLERAALIAYVAHGNQKRKDDGSPYFIHPCRVALKLTSYGFSDEIVAAGFGHDILEDTPIKREELESILGAAVVQMIGEVSEDKTLPWEQRKQEYVKTVCQASEGAKAVSIADKIHNLESLLSAHAALGPDVWKSFNRGKEQKIWFEKMLLSEIRKVWQHPMVEEHAQLVAKLDALS